MKKLSKAAKAKVDEQLGSRKDQREMNKELVRLRDIITQYAEEKREYIVEQRKPSNTLRFAIASDAHIGSLYERVDAMEAFYKACKKEGIFEVYNPGDIVDGHGIYKGQEFEQYAHGYDEQAKAFAERYPRIKGMRTIFITGNHDLSYKKEVGADIGKKLHGLRPDCEYIGAEYGKVKMFTKQKRPFTLHLVHPGGGTAYAVSYKTQKLIESLPGGTKPNMLAIGHFHKAEWLPQYRNVSGFQAGCFQGQTPFMARRPTPAHVGGWMVEVVVGDPKKLVMRVKAEFIGFFEPEAR